MFPLGLDLYPNLDLGLGIVVRRGGVRARWRRRKMRTPLTTLVFSNVRTIQN